MSMLYVWYKQWWSVWLTWLQLRSSNAILLWHHVNKRLNYYIWFRFNSWPLFLLGMTTVYKGRVIYFNKGLYTGSVVCYILFLLLIVRHILPNHNHTPPIRPLLFDWHVCGHTWPEQHQMWVACWNIRKTYLAEDLTKFNWLTTPKQCRKTITCSVSEIGRIVFNIPIDDTDSTYSDSVEITGPLKDAILSKA